MITVTPPKENKLYGLDHLRALAITLVFFYHYQNPIFGHPGWLPGVAKFGWTGVDLFFVLSGFLISSQLFAKIRIRGSISYKEFFLKRFFRIVPAFWVVVAIYFCFPFFHEREKLPPLWKFLTFTQNLGLNVRDTRTFSHAWSLCVEEHFYFFLPVTLIVLGYARLIKKAYWFLIGLFLFGFVIRYYAWQHMYLPNINSENGALYWYEYIYYPTYTRLDGLLVGVSIAALYEFLPAVWNKIAGFGNYLIVLGLLVLTAACFLCEDQSSFYATLYGFPTVAIGYGFLVAGAVSPFSFLYKWNSKITTFIATLSYALYLTHKGIIHMTQALLDKVAGADSDTMMLICIPACIAGALILHLVIEKPFMKMRKKIISRSKTIPGNVPALAIAASVPDQQNEMPHTFSGMGHQVKN